MLLIQNVYNAANFQVSGLSEQCQYYQKVCLTLKEKCGRQQQLLFKAKQELDNIPKLRNRIKELEEKLKYSSSSDVDRVRRVSKSNSNVPPTVDLTQENDDEQFISKFKSNRVLKATVNRKSRDNIVREHSSDIGMPMTQETFAVAESTHISKNTPITSDNSGNIKPVRSSIVGIMNRSTNRIDPLKNSQNSITGNNSRIPELLSRLKLKRNHTVEERSNQMTQRTFLMSQKVNNETIRDILNPPLGYNALQLRRSSNSQQINTTKKRSSTDSSLRISSNNKFRRLK
ncbi:Chromosome stability protein 9 [Nakaseomyces bracarensis]|uniref:Chromosome stability protein 9 n=1 Tax=Nakaseomyces bracarensis TaxID=273131 RepID=A0ABR4NST4_9SACH